MTKRQQRNAERIVALANAFGHLAYNAAGQTPEGILNLSIPCARLVVAGVVTRVADTNDGVNDNAVAAVEEVCQRAVAFTTDQHGRGWWNDTAVSLGIVRRAA